MPPHKVKLVYKNYVFFHINNVHLLRPISRIIRYGFQNGNVKV